MTDNKLQFSVKNRDYIYTKTYKNLNHVGDTSC